MIFLRDDVIKEHVDILCKKNTENLNPKIFKTKIGRLMIRSKCADCGIKKSRFGKEQEAKSLFSNLRSSILECFVLNSVPLMV